MADVASGTAVDKAEMASFLMEVIVYRVPRACCFVCDSCFKIGGGERAVLSTTETAW